MKHSHLFLIRVSKTCFSSKSLLTFSICVLTATIASAQTGLKQIGFEEKKIQGEYRPVQKTTSDDITQTKVEETATVLNLSKQEAIPDPLPVKVTVIILERPKYRNILMAWETASEINNQQFMVYHSLDGENWTEAGILKGAGTSSTVNKYQFNDDISEELAMGAKQMFYRLKQVDFNGTTWTSNVLSIKLNKFESEMTLAVSPNPATDHVFVSGLGESMQVVDMQGREVMNVLTPNGSAEIRELIPGIYFVRSGEEFRKLVIR